MRGQRRDEDGAQISNKFRLFLLTDMIQHDAPWCFYLIFVLRLSCDRPAGSVTLLSHSISLNFNIMLPVSINKGILHY